MNAIRFGLYTGILWAGASLLLIELSILNGALSAWVELDFRFLTGITLIILHSLDLGANLSELIHYAQFGMPVNTLNTIIALVTGFFGRICKRLFYCNFLQLFLYHIRGEKLSDNSKIWYSYGNSARNLLGGC